MHGLALSHLVVLLKIERRKARRKPRARRRRRRRGVEGAEIWRLRR